MNLMRYESNAFGESILKKMVIPFIIFLIITIIKVFAYLKTPKSMIDINYAFNSLSGIITKETIVNLFLIWQLVLTILGFYFYLSYEEDNSLEFIKTRTNNINICLNKTFIYLIFIIVFRSCYFYLIKNVFDPDMLITFKHFWLTLYPHIVIIFLMTFIVMGKNYIDKL